MRTILIFAIAVMAVCQTSIAQDTIKVHFLYGSKPAQRFKNVEKPWFGGIHGGHVGIETGADSVLSFMPDGGFHLIDQGKDRNSRYGIHTPLQFWRLFGLATKDVKRLSVVIPVSSRQKALLDSISTAYLKETPYDYALMGMRCGSAATEILARIGVLDKELQGKGAKYPVFYPKLLRVELISMAEKQGWALIRQEGTYRRRWETD